MYHVSEWTLARLRLLYASRFDHAARLQLTHPRHLEHLLLSHRHDPFVMQELRAVLAETARPTGEARRLSDHEVVTRLAPVLADVYDRLLEPSSPALSVGGGEPSGGGGAVPSVADTAAALASHGEPTVAHRPESQAETRVAEPAKPDQTHDKKASTFIELTYTYRDGAPVAGAPFRVRFADGTEETGSLGDDGVARLEGLPPAREGTAEVSFGEDARPWTPQQQARPVPNPSFRGEQADTALIGKPPLVASSSDEAAVATAAGSRFTQAPDKQEDVLDWLWGLVLGDFKEDPSTGQVVSGAIITMIPVIDQVADVRDICANLYRLHTPEGRRDEWTWIALVVTLVGLVPIVGSAVKGVLKVVLKRMKEGGGATRRALFAVLRRLGRGNPETFIARHLDPDTLTRQAKQHFADVMAKVRSFFELLRDSWLVTNRVSRAAATVLEQLRAIERMADGQIERAVRRLRGEIDAALGRGTSDRVATGRTGKRVEAQAEEMEPPDLGAAPRLHDADLAESLDRIDALITGHHRVQLRTWFDEGLDPAQLEVALRHASDPQKLFDQLSNAKSVFHRRVLINDRVDAIPGIEKGAYVSDGLRPITRRALDDGPSEYDLPADAARNFSSARFMELEEGDKLYRVLGPGTYETGGYWTRTKPASYQDVFGGSAVMPEWNGCTQVIEYTVPPGGIKVWVGETAAQPIAGDHNPLFDQYTSRYHLPGGAEQVYMPEVYRDYTDSATLERFNTAITQRESISWTK